MENLDGDDDAADPAGEGQDADAELRAMLREIEKFATTELNADLIARDRDATFPREAWRRCASIGIQGLPFPIELGGAGASVVSTVRVMEALGGACRDNGLLFALNAQMWSVQFPILRFGDEGQRRRFLPRLCSGDSIGAHAMTEPGSGSDAFSLATTARRDGDDYVLRGAKTFVTSAPVADLFVAFARTAGGTGPLGISAFVVERDTPGLAVGKPIEKMGLRTSPMAEVVFDDCRVPAANRLSCEGDGARVFMHAMNLERACLLATAVGSMDQQLERCLRQARGRQQSGRPIARFQAVAHRLSDMHMRLTTSRLLLHRAAAAAQRGSADLALVAATAKLHISESWVASCLDAIQIHGGYGYTTEFEVERDLRDAVASRLYSGTSDVQRNVIASELGT